MFPKCEQKIEDRHTHLYSKALLKKIQQVLEEVQLWEGLSANNNDEKKVSHGQKHDDDDWRFF